MEKTFHHPPTPGEVSRFLLQVADVLEQHAPINTTDGHDAALAEIENMGARARVDPYDCNHIQVTITHPQGKLVFSLSMLADYVAQRARKAARTNHTKNAREASAARRWKPNTRRSKYSSKVREQLAGGAEGTEEDKDNARQYFREFFPQA